MFKRTLRPNWEPLPGATAKSASCLSVRIVLLMKWYRRKSEIWSDDRPVQARLGGTGRSPGLQWSVIPRRPGLTRPPIPLVAGLVLRNPAMNHRRYGRRYVNLIKYRFPLPLPLFYLFIYFFGLVLSKVPEQFCQQMESVTRVMLIWALIISFFFFCFLEEQIAFWWESLAGGANRKQCPCFSANWRKWELCACHCPRWRQIQSRRVRSLQIFEGGILNSNFELWKHTHIAFSGQKFQSFSFLGFCLLHIYWLIRSENRSALNQLTRANMEGSF